jgi:23S rRNA (adenine-N6)-dimethyltransferase
MNHHHYGQYNGYSQNETTNGKLLKSLIDRTSITKGDLVYDIGSGTGNITEALLAKEARVISIEKDARLYHKCRERFLGRDAASIHHADFLNWEYSGYRYKVFANIPFIQTADIVKKLLSGNTPPQDCYLIMQKEAALKYAGIPKETLSSLMIKPKFWVDIVFYFSRKDFYPPPAVDIVLIQFEKRQCRLIPEDCYEMYRDFIVYCREGGHSTIEKALKNIFSYEQLKQVAALSGLDLHSRPLELNCMQYLCIFQFLLGDNLKNISFIQGAEARLIQKRADLKKRHRTDIK